MPYNKYNKAYILNLLVEASEMLELAAEELHTTPYTGEEAVIRNTAANVSQLRDTLDGYPAEN